MLNDRLVSDSSDIPRLTVISQGFVQTIDFSTWFKRNPFHFNQASVFLPVNECVSIC